ncbi:hypothetical protein BDV18DRAFT_149248 [Aspergillus unguis]
MVFDYVKQAWGGICLEYLTTDYLLKLLVCYVLPRMTQGNTQMGGGCIQDQQGSVCISNGEDRENI